MPKLLDLFCGAGGAGMGYHRAGFEVVGVDINPQPNYPFEFIQGDALEVGRAIGAQFDAIHASPPCQRFSPLAALHPDNDYPDLVDDVRALLRDLGKPYAIENVPDAPLQSPLILCGTMFGLRVLRHRAFECNPPIWFPPAVCNHWGQMAPSKGVYHSFEVGDFITVAGNNYVREDGMVAMGVDWYMTRPELSEAIPPAYTEFIGKHLMAARKEALIKP